MGKAAIDNDVHEVADAHRTIAEDESGLSIKLTVIAVARFREVFPCAGMHPWLGVYASEGADGNRVVVLRVLPVVEDKRIDLVLIEIFEDGSNDSLHRKLCGARALKLHVFHPHDDIGNGIGVALPERRLLRAGNAAVEAAEHCEGCCHGRCQGAHAWPLMDIYEVAHLADHAAYFRRIRHEPGVADAGEAEAAQGFTL